MKKHTYQYIKIFIESKDYQLLSDSYTNAHKKLLLKCPSNHTFEINFNNFKSGQKCPICEYKLKKLHLYQYIKNFIESKDYQLLSDDYINTHTKLLLKCPIGHEYKTSFNIFKNGHRCPYCAGNKKLSYSYVKSYIESKGYQLLSKEYKNNHTKLLLKCPEDHEYNVAFGNFLIGKRCPFCNKLSYDYVKGYIESKGYQLLSKKYINVKQKLLLKCPIGHEYKVTWSNFKIGSRCPLCNNINRSCSYQYIKSFIENEGYQLLSKKYVNSNTKLLLKCPKEHEYKVKFSHFKNKHRCPVCWNESTSSKQEKELQDYIESLGYSIIRNDRSQIINPLTGHNLELDIWIPDLNKAIEYNGTYWHSLNERKEYDKIKAYQCKQKDVDLLIVNEINWINNKKNEQKLIKLWIKGEKHEKK